MGGVNLALLCALALPACVEPEDRVPERAPLPDVHFVSRDGILHQEYVDGAHAWEFLGFDFIDERYAGPLPECDRFWYVDHVKPCVITITVVVDPYLIEKYGADGAAFRAERQTHLDDSVWQHGSAYVAMIVAHEVGHVLLDTDVHTAEGLLSGAQENKPLWPSPEDSALACQEIGVCL